jgi:PEGA domain
MKGRIKVKVKVKNGFITVLTILNLLLLQCCSLVNPQVSQDVPVTSTPVGARVTVDGKDAGQAPLLLDLKRKRSHTIRIEKEGYNPAEVRISSKLSARFAIEVAFVPLWVGLCGVGVTLIEAVLTGFSKSSEHYNRTGTTAMIISAPIGVAMVVGDTLVGRNHKLTPRDLKVTLTKTEGHELPRVSVINLDEKQFKEIRWIRIELAEAGKK